MVTTTTTYSFKKPTVGQDEDLWGGYLNDSMDLIDDVLDGTTPVTGIDINSGTIDNAVIGGTTPVAGTFTTLTANTSLGVTGNITVSGTVDGVDIATRDGVLTTTTTTANAALPKAGGTMTGAITFAAGQTFDGRDVSADGAKLDGIESGATADQTASEILTAIKTVDGAASGLDADVLDGQQGSYYLDYNNFTNTPTVSTDAQTLDGLDSTQFLRSDTADTMGGNLTLNGTLSLGSYTINDVEDIYLRDKMFHSGNTGTYVGLATNTINLTVGSSTEVTITQDGAFFNNCAIREDYDALSGTSPSINTGNGGAFSLTMTGNTTFSFSSSSSSGYGTGFVLQLTGNGSTVTWPASVDWAGGTAPDAPASGETDILVFWTRDGGTTWYGVLSIDAAS